MTIDRDRWHKAHPDLWTYSVDLRVLGAHAGRRMTAVRHSDGAWALIGPVPLSDRSRDELRAEGDVDALVVPCAFHNRFVAESCTAFPRAEVYVAGGATTRHLPAERVHALPADLPASITGVLEPVEVGGIPMSNEVVLFHRPSRTAIFADVCMHFPEPDRSRWSNVFKRLAGWTPGVRIPTLMRKLIRDRDAFVASLDRIAALEPERLLPSHGEPVTDDASAALARMRAQVAR